MARTPEERRETNRRNAQRSTGPRTPEGKQRARLNALKHGLRAEEFALPGEDQEELKRLTDEWVEYYEPRSPGERAVLDRCVYATLQAKRCARFHAEAVAEQVRSAREDWNHKQENEFAELKALLHTAPAEAVRKLKRSTKGCRWLIEQWTQLLEPLDAGQFWVTSEREQATRLCGELPDPAQYRTSHLAYYLAYYGYFCRQKWSEEYVLWLLDDKQMPDWFKRSLQGGGPPTDADSRSVLRQLAQNAIAELEAREDRLRTEVEGPSLAGLVHRSLLLAGPEGALLARYERMHDTAYHRAYKALLKGEVEHEDDVAPSAPAPMTLLGGVEVLDITAAKTGAPNEATEATAVVAGTDQKKTKADLPESLEPVGVVLEGFVTVAPGVATVDPPVSAGF
jgi:hypothetical protein